MKFRHRLLLPGAIFLALFSSAPADVTLPHVFGDHMVLQSGQPVPVWGWANPGDVLTVRFAGQEKHATAAAGDGRWEARLDPLAASAQPADLTISGSDSLTFKDVLVGEVWLCSGQSNMEKPVGEQRGQKPTLNYEEELRAANYPLIRLLKIPKSRIPAPARDFKAGWVECGPASLDDAKFSAAGYFFGRKLFQELNVPVGLIDSTYGGTRIEPWTSPAGFAGVPSLAEFANASLTPGVKVEGAELCTLYNGMIHPLAPFAMRGVIWYQGESNIMDVDDGARYADKMTALVEGWRGDWKRELPFYYVQVAPHLYHVVRPAQVVSPEAEPRLWEAQTASMRLPRTGMVVTTDLVDDLADIHPRDKKDVGERLARWALAKDYGRNDIEVSGPLFTQMEVQGNRAILHFDHVGGGLVSSDAKPLTWFDMAGADGKIFPGAAVIEGDTVVVTSPRVPAPAIVHFAWDEAARPNFANKAGLPGVPFRTDGPVFPPLPQGPAQKQ